jgi:predicted ATPase
MPRYILTGAPGAGKTAILRLLELGGFAVVEEAATDVIALEQALGHARQLDRTFVDRIVSLQQMRLTSAGLPGADAMFFDRSPVCTLALSRFLGLAPSALLSGEVERLLPGDVYEATVFFVRNQGWIEATPARRIPFEDSLRFERLHEQTYRERGFDLIEVPAAPLTERVALVLEEVGVCASIQVAGGPPLRPQ